ncbi:hypothetical protein BC628DRAFT_1416678 [Trametes gibbosa]|nr:hypothetical protein BC628DRAFT_1416678 [Trametes gibbosa]
MASAPHHLSHQVPTVLSLPAEINQIVLSYLDCPMLTTCALTCRRWTPSAQYLLFRFARVSSPASAQKFALALSESAHLRALVIELTVCGRLADSVKPWMCSRIDLTALLPSPKLVPRMRSLRIEYWDRVYSTTKLWALLRRYKNVTALHLRCCHFQTSHHIEDFIFAFPHLATLTIDSVRWNGDRERVFVRRPEYEGRTLSLQTLRICNPYEYAPLFQWLTAHRCVGVSRLELVRFDVMNITSAAAYVKELGAALQSLTFGIYLPSCYDVSVRRLNLAHNTSLRALSLQVYDVTDVRWMSSVLASAVEHPLARVALALTLDHRKTLWEAAWDAIASALSMYWRTTLSEVVFTHHAVPGFLQDVKPLIVERLPELAARGVLSVIVDTQDE